MTKNHDIDLMQHADGELDDRELEELLGRDADARAKVDAIGELGEVVRGHLELAGDALPAKRFEAMWSEIDKQLDLPVPAADVPAKRASTSMDRPGVWGKLTRWIDKKAGYVITGVASAGAVATIALLMRGPTTTVIEQQPIPVQPAVHRPTELESLETPGGTGTVLRIGGDDGDATVIWVTADDTEEL